MKWPVLNLRFDLARLRDDELADRLRAAWRAYEAGETRALRRKLFGTLSYSARGPIRHPFAYWCVSFLAVKGPSFTFFFGPPLGLLWHPVLDMHLSLCEIRDIGDEMERRGVIRPPPALAPSPPRR